jgi:hypothetical protein
MEMISMEWWETITDANMPYHDYHAPCIEDGEQTSWRCGVCEKPVCFDDMSNHLAAHGVIESENW